LAEPLSRKKLFSEKCEFFFLVEKFDGFFGPFCDRDRSRYVMGLGPDCPVALRGLLCDEFAVMLKKHFVVTVPELS